MVRGIDIEEFVGGFPNRSHSEEVFNSSSDQIMINSIKEIMNSWDPYRLRKFPEWEYWGEIWDVMFLLRNEGEMSDLLTYFILLYADHPIKMLSQDEKDQFILQCRVNVERIFNITRGGC